MSYMLQSTEQQVHGVLNLIDLAGSERLSRSGATGDRLKETQVGNFLFWSEPLTPVVLLHPCDDSTRKSLTEECVAGNQQKLV
jgi:hypothetical protein